MYDFEAISSDSHSILPAEHWRHSDVADRANPSVGYEGKPLQTVPLSALKSF